MLGKIFTKGGNETVYQLVYFYCICLMLISLPTSIYFVSVAQILMGANWLVEGHYREKFHRFINNRPALIISSIYLLYLAGIFWTNDLRYGIGYDLQNKLPLLTLTFLLTSSRPLPQNRLNALLVVFSLAVFVTSLIGLGIYLGNPLIDPRKFSPFISHVYLGMMVVLVVFLLPWTVNRMNLERNWFRLSLGISAWLLIYLIILGSMTGFLCLLGVLLFLLLREIFSAPAAIRKILATMVLVMGVAGITALYLFVAHPVGKTVDPDPSSFSDTTSLGNEYRHDLTENQRENGHLVYFFIAEKELRDAWNERSQIDFDSLDLRSQEIRATIFRYLSSMGLRKDRAGLNQLSSEDIEAIEIGVPNHLYTKWPNVLVRLHQSIWEIHEYARTGNPTGHTFTQRLELWKASWVAFRKYPVFGWGTGDVFGAMNYGLKEINSQLDNFKMKPHNQFLILLIMLGVPGLVLFFGLFFLFVKMSKAYRFLPFNIMLLIVLVAMLGNNLIDFQIGLTFFLFFSLFFGILYQSQTSNNVSSTE